jgi:hypothetical protein
VRMRRESRIRIVRFTSMSYTLEKVIVHDSI